MKKRALFIICNGIIKDVKRTNAYASHVLYNNFFIRPTILQEVLYFAHAKLEIYLHGYTKPYTLK